MRKIIAALQVLVDGFIEGPNGESGWAKSVTGQSSHSGWRKGAVQGREGATCVETRKGEDT